MHDANASGNFQKKYGTNLSIRTTRKPLNYIILCIFHNGGPNILLPELRECDYLEEKIQNPILAVSQSFPL
jgi:hypothetical protein